MSTSRSVAFHTLGCKLNFSETSSISSSFRKAGYQEVEFEEAADIYVINTCSVTDQADKKCRKIIRSAKKRNPEGKIVVIGCYAQLKPNEISSIPGVNLVLGAAEKFKILEHIQELDLQNFHSRVIYSPIQEISTFEPSYSKEGRTRAFLKVQDGCDYKCSFCTIPQARGRSRSATIEQIFIQAQSLVSQGVKEIVLTGVNIGDFGNGTEVLEGARPKKNDLFIDLIHQLDEIDGEIRFRISSIEPNLCNDEIIEFVSRSKKFMPHFHMPLQSGDNEILSLMKRRYQRELYSQRVQTIKSLIPHACIGVDVIVGFPGETNSHFENSFQFLESLDVEYLHVFSYSERNNTPASLMPGFVPVQLRHQRSEALRNLSIKKRHQFYTNFIGQTMSILVEGRLETVNLSGFTENYIRVNLAEKSGDLINQIKKVKLIKLDSSLEMIGELC